MRFPTHLFQITETKGSINSTIPKLMLLATVMSISLFSTACFESKIVTTKIDDPLRRPTSMNGVFYALPRTVVKVNVPIDRVDKEPGQYVEFRQCFYPDLPDNAFTLVKSTEFGVDEDKVSFDTLPIPDTSEVYLIKTQGGRFETRNLELALTESGVFVKGVAENTNNTIDIVTGAISTAASLGKSISGLSLLSSAPQKARFVSSLPISQRNCYTDHEATLIRALDVVIQRDPELPARGHISVSEAKGNQAAREAAVRSLEELILNEQTGDQIRERDDVLKIVLRYPDVATALQRIEDFQNAKAAFDKIMALEAQRQQLLNPTTLQAPMPPETLKLMLTELDSLIKDLKETNFFGTKTEKTWNTSFRLNPNLAIPANPTAGVAGVPAKMKLELFKLSTYRGVGVLLVDQGLKLDGRFSAPQNPACQNQDPKCDYKIVWLEMVKGENGEGGAGGTTLPDSVGATNLAQDGDRGFYYRIPGRAVAFLYAGKTSSQIEDQLSRSTVSIAQFGKTVSLPATTGGRRTKYDLALYESSGALKNFIMGSDALIQKSNVEDVGAAASTIVEAKAERKKAKAPKTELEELENQRKILEERKKIRDLEKELTPTP